MFQHDPELHRFHVGDGVHLTQRRVFFDTFTLESGQTLRKVDVGYNVWGELNATRSNVIVVCHALTGHSDVSSWWSEIHGPGKPLDTNKFFIVCANVLGSPYGTASPVTVNPDTGAKYGASFPQVTVRDTVQLHKRLLREVLHVERVFAVVGASLGGMQALEWGFLGQDFVSHLVLIAACARQSPWCIGWSETQRQAITNDPNWNNGNYTDDAPPSAGLANARMIAMLTYRSASSLEERFARQEQKPEELPQKYRTDRPDDPYFFNIQSYLRYQGRKLVQRYDANCYMRLTQMMDTHDVCRKRVALPEVPAFTAAKSDRPQAASDFKEAFHAVLATVRQRALVIAVESDLLYTVAEQREMAECLPNAKFVSIHAKDGHDGFLVEFAQLNVHVQAFLDAEYTQ